MAYIHVEHEKGAEPEFIPLSDTLESSDGTRFNIGRMLWGGKGGNGVVFEAIREGGMGYKCAIKVLKRLDGQRIDRFNNEINVLKQLDHEHISSYLGDGTINTRYGDPTPWVAVDLGGPNLRMHVDEHGPLASAELREIGIQICGALKHLHERDFIHRDLKPANFVWTAANTSNRIMMIDFGLAKRTGENTAGRPFDQFTQVGEFVGPVFYSSHELIEYARDQRTPVDYRSDLFQFGRVMWFLATGTPGAGIPSHKRDPTGGPLYDLVMQLLPDDPDDRLCDLDLIEDKLKLIS